MITMEADAGETLADKEGENGGEESYISFLWVGLLLGFRRGVTVKMGRAYFQVGLAYGFGVYPLWTTADREKSVVIIISQPFLKSRCSSDFHVTCGACRRCHQTRSNVQISCQNFTVQDNHRAVWCPMRTVTLPHQKIVWFVPWDEYTGTFE